jgi:hypothetical protein
MFTPEAEIEQMVIQLHFPTLWKNYNSMMGNFEFTAPQFRQKIRPITKWMQTFDGYRIVIEEGYFYLTNI